MAFHIHDALKNTKEIYMSDSSLSTLLSVERVIDELDVYAFKHWKLGELVAGPKYEKYFVTCTFMWPYKKMPDPRGGEQLLNYNCEVTYKKDVLEYPVKPKSPEDYKQGTKMPKTKRTPIWLVTITIPKKLMNDIQQGSLEISRKRLDDTEQEKENKLIDKEYENGANQPAPQGGMGGDDMQQMPGGMM